MNKMHLTPKSYFWLVFILLLVACGTSNTAVPATSTHPTLIHPTPTITTPTFVAPATITRTKIVNFNVFLTQLWMTSDAAVTLTIAARPTRTITSTPMPPSATYTRGPSWTPMATPTPLKPYALNGLRAAYILDGNLYLQDSGVVPFQLSDGGMDGFPQFSDDGQRLIVHRDTDIFVFHLNHDEEDKKLVLAKLLPPLKLGYDKSASYDMFFVPPVFVPHTHQLLFQTAGNTDLLLLDVDSHKVSQLLPIGSQARYFQPSPDGKLAWAWVKDHIDVVNLRSKSRQRVADYIPFAPRLARPLIYWTNDSKHLNIILPIFRGTPVTNEPLPQAIWQVALDGSSPVEMRFDPPVKLSGDTFSISPDGNWIVYSYCNYQLDSPDNLHPDGTYLGNLRTGETQFIDLKEDPGCLARNYHWASDSTHFIFEPFLHRNFYLGNIHKEVVQLNQKGGFLNWLDTTRYLRESTDGNRISDTSIAMGYTSGNEAVRVLALPPSLPYRTAQNFAYIFLNP